jgi:predicted short-subunit dehydrogenase-like oxidoreductase (DUF2520 family)
MPLIRLPKLGFIGAGTVGSALAIRLSERGYTVAAVASRSYSSAVRLASSVPGCCAYEDLQQAADNADLIFITTPDAAIPQVAAVIKWRKGQYVVHCSGADSTAILEPARKLGAGVGCIHPLQTFADTRQAIENLPGSTFALEAEPLLLDILKEITVALNGSPVVLKPEDKEAYHASAVIASNYLVTLVKMSTDLWLTFGIPREQATASLLPLLKGTLNNIATIGIPGCLTGPIARGDAGTVIKHIGAMKKLTPGLVPAYRELGRQTIPIGLAKGKLGSPEAEKIREILDEG